MVHRTAKQSKVKKQKNKKSSISISIILGVLLIIPIIYLGLHSHKEVKEEKIDEESTEQIVPPEELKPRLVDLQPVIDTWASSLPRVANFGIVIYDIENDKIIAEKNADEFFSTASLYKLFVVYEGYRRVEQDIWEKDNSLTSEYTIGECLDLAIRESNSICAEILWAKIGRNEVENIINNSYQLYNTSVNGLYSTPRDVMKMLKIYYNHTELSKETYEIIEDSMLNQPQTYDSANCAGYCDWRQGLPSGFSANVKVYNKVGWEGNGTTWKIYNDAAIVSFPNYNHNYIIVVMTENLNATKNTVTELKNLAESIEQSVNAAEEND